MVSTDEDTDTTHKELDGIDHWLVTTEKRMKLQTEGLLTGIQDNCVIWTYYKSNTIPRQDRKSNEVLEQSSRRSNGAKLAQIILRWNFINLLKRLYDVVA